MIFIEFFLLLDLFVLLDLNMIDLAFKPLRRLWTERDIDLFDL